MICRSMVSRGLLLGLVGLAVGGCDSTGPDGPSGPGSFQAILISPSGDEGSAVFELTGGVGLGAVSTVGGEAFYEHSGGSTRVVVVRDDPGEIRFQIWTENLGRLPEVSVVQVADGENQLRASPASYSVQLSAEGNSSQNGLGGAP